MNPSALVPTLDHRYKINAKTHIWIPFFMVHFPSTTLSLDGFNIGLSFKKYLINHFPLWVKCHSLVDWRFICINKHPGILG